MDIGTEYTTHRDVRSVGLQLLLVAREVARRSPAEAHVRFGLEPAEARLLAEADVQRLSSLADEGRATFKPLFTRNDLAAIAS